MPHHVSRPLSRMFSYARIFLEHILCSIVLLWSFARFLRQFLHSSPHIAQKYWSRHISGRSTAQRMSREAGW
ncbi:hypothetical protein R3P38DRAFT_2907569 [Favolaschia claudopus]|uniref:Uncharacterized protein n=1 Tax=Favolaschia claudopus TaxID=2862362 RepID=A0AAW0CDD5_9AGAR